MSKRIAAVLAILLCLILYFSFLLTLFTKKVDTFIVYTQEGITTVHGSHNCRTSEWDGFGYKTAFDTTKPIITTTTYHTKDYDWCRECSGKMEQTTITVKNHYAPLLISAPISLVVYLLLIKKKTTT